ncbi:MAG: DNA repair protein RadC [Blautia sp.]|nr:DNA repair protein RadC [Blautia sp.]
MKKNEKRIKDLPAAERPYEKCLQAGPQALCDRDLLAVILRCGLPGMNSLELADQILEKLNASPFPGFPGLLHLSAKDLMGIPGIGQVKAVQLQCIGELSRRISMTSARRKLSFHDPYSIGDYYMEQLRHEEQEHLIMMMLDSKNNFLAESILAKGTVNEAHITPREIFVDAFRNHAVGIILVHNHPSGDPAPSHSDIAFTGRILACGDMVGVELLDHIIIGDRRIYSFREERLLDSLREKAHVF